jgi:hypothetical protein
MVIKNAQLMDVAPGPDFHAAMGSVLGTGVFNSDGELSPEDGMTLV